MLEYITILLFIGITYGAYKLIWWYRHHQYRKEFADMYESELWKEKEELEATINEYYHGAKAGCTPPQKLVERRRCLLLELDRRDLLDGCPAQEQQYAESLKEIYDIFVYKEFSHAWDKLCKDNEHPRRAAIYFALAREELIKRYRRKCAALSDDEVKLRYQELCEKQRRENVSRDTYEYYRIFEEEMQKRRIPV
jgi:hypothetical protein